MTPLAEKILDTKEALTNQAMALEAYVDRFFDMDEHDRGRGMLLKNISSELGRSLAMLEEAYQLSQQQGGSDRHRA